MLDSQTHEEFANIMMKPLTRKAAKLALKAQGEIPKAKSGDNLVCLCQTFNKMNIALPENIKLARRHRKLRQNRGVTTSPRARGLSP